jgi:hypothetical protein
MKRSIFYIFAAVTLNALVCGCEGINYDPTPAPVGSEQAYAEVRGDVDNADVRPATVGDAIQVGTDTAHAIDAGRADGFNADDAEAVANATAPLLNPLTGGWFSAAAGLGILVWRELENRNRKRIIQAVQDSPNGPDVVNLVPAELRRKAAKLAA